MKRKGKEKKKERKVKAVLYSQILTVSGNVIKL